MMSSDLVGLKIRIESNNFINFSQYAVICDLDFCENKILLKLDTAYKSDGKVYKYVIASPRLVGDKFANFQKNGLIGCSMTWIPETEFDIKEPMNLSWWRGGGAAIADLTLY